MRAFFRYEACGDWFDMRDLGAVLDHEEPLPHPMGDAVASLDHQRSVVTRRRDGRGTDAPAKFDGTTKPR
jgi:hypothetical protein